MDSENTNVSIMIIDALTDLRDIVKYLPNVKKSDAKKLNKYLDKLENDEETIYEEWI